MAAKAVAYVRDVTLSSGDITFHMDIQIDSGTRHYSLVSDAYSVDALMATTISNLRAWAKDYAENTMSQSFGLLDTVKLVNADLL